MWSHITCMLSDPGAVPPNARPLSFDVDVEGEGEGFSSCGHEHVTCGLCDSYKPPFSHHDRVSGRCISRMDHFCPWTNNAIGAKNQKSFLLFLLYCCIASFYMYIVLGLNIRACGAMTCSQIDPDRRAGFSSPAHALKLEAVILLFACIFTTAMLFTQISSLMSGIGTIDRLQLRRGQAESAPPVPFRHVFGDDLPYTYFLPLPPYFKHPEEVLHYQVSGYSCSSSDLLKT